MKARVYELESKEGNKLHAAVTIFGKVYTLSRYKAFHLRYVNKRALINSFGFKKTNTYIDIVKTSYGVTRYEYYHIKGDRVDE